MTFERVFNHIVDLCPHLMPKNTYCIYEWLAAGYDPEKDIIPAVDYATRNGVRCIQAFSYFTGAIRKFHAKRLQQPPEQTIERSQEEKDAIRARNIRWHRERGITTTSVGIQDYQWLEHYEKEHGPISL